MKNARTWTIRGLIFAAWTLAYVMLLNLDTVRTVLRHAETKATSWTRRPYVISGSGPRIYVVSAPRPVTEERIDVTERYFYARATQTGATYLGSGWSAAPDLRRGLPSLEIVHPGDGTHEPYYHRVLSLDIDELPTVPKDGSALRSLTAYWGFDDWGYSGFREVVFDDDLLPPESFEKIPLDEMIAGVWDGRLRGSILVSNVFSAATFAALRDGRYLEPLPRWIYRASWVVAIFAFLLLLASTTAPRLFRLALVVAIALAAGSLLARRLGYIPCFAYAEGYFVGGGFLVATQELARFIRERARLHAAFRRYVSREVADQLLSRGERDMLAGRTVTLTVLFLDVRGFTSFSARTPPEEVVQVLNVFFAEMIEIVFRHKGTVSKLIGDALFAYFGEPLECDHAVEASAAAAEMVSAAARVLPPGVTIGIGIHTGPVVVGNFGTKRYMEYTAVGRTVRIAYALQNAARKHMILVSGETRGAARLEGRTVPAEPIRDEDTGAEVATYALTD